MNLKLHSASLAISLGCHLVFKVANASATDPLGTTLDSSYSNVRKSSGSGRRGIIPGQERDDADADRKAHDSTLAARRMSGDSTARMLHEPRMPSMHDGDAIMVESMTDGESVMVGMANPAASNCIDNGLTYKDLLDPTGGQLNSFF